MTYTQTHGYENIMTLENDYKYHWRLNNDIKFLQYKQFGKRKATIICYALQP